jgi:hypothetical protein
MKPFRKSVRITPAASGQELRGVFLGQFGEVGLVTLGGRLAGAASPSTTQA